MDEKNSFITSSQWEKIGVRHHHGIIVPLRSLHSKNSFGFGDFSDLLSFITYLYTTGFSLVQLLPLNDTGNDPSPYMGVSSCALHPLYLSLHMLPNASQTLPPSLPKPSNYKEALEQKLHFLSKYLEKELPQIQEDPSFQFFLEEEDSWLHAYALFKSLKEMNSEKAFWDFRVKDLPRNHPSIMKWKAIQFLLFKQMKEVKKKADSLGIHLVGDIPILINKDSSDYFRHPELFLKNLTVGAPPDMYNKEGQSWGFPLFKWSEHEKTHFSWWRKRLKTQEKFYHLFRIDHIVGFYRFWAIKKNQKAKDGSFVPDSSKWEELGEEILHHLVSSTSMLPLGEDLGDIPDMVRSSMQKMGIPGLKVLRWERRWKEDQSFIHPKLFSPESVATVSTHDSSTLQGWWQENSDESRRFAHDFHIPWHKKLSPNVHYEILSMSHQAGSLFHINLLQEYLSLFPELSWNNPQKDRINVPGTISPTNWAWRPKPFLDTIFHHQGLKDVLKKLSST